MDKLAYGLLTSGQEYQYRKSTDLPLMTAKAAQVCNEFNTAFHKDIQNAREWLYAQIPNIGTGVEIIAPFKIDYLERIIIGDRSFLNTDFLVIGGGLIEIGEDVLIGPRCGLYTSNHSLDNARRLEGYETGEGISIGDNTWLGGSITVCPGVKIGKNVVIGAGSVVTRDIPDNVIAAGNPCRIIRENR